MRKDGDTGAVDGGSYFRVKIEFFTESSLCVLRIGLTPRGRTYRRKHGEVDTSADA